MLPRRAYFWFSFATILHHPAACSSLSSQERKAKKEQLKEEEERARRLRERERERMDLSGHDGDIPIPIPIPIPITSTYVVGHGPPHGHGMTHDTSPLHHRSSGSPPPPAAASAAPPPPLSAATTEDHHHRTNPYSTKKGLVVKYRECLKNHAAAIGGNATDGCGEFMPSGEEGTLEALKCSACNCHRNFHRKEVEGESSYDCYHPFKGRKAIGQRGLLISGADPFGYNPGSNSLIPRPPPHMIMPLGAMQTSESDEMEGAGGGMMARPPLVKKRFRTKFTVEQKEKMLHFAETVGWRLQKQEESAVQQFCQEIGVKRRVLKVWMHNNKHNLAKKTPLQLE